MIRPTLEREPYDYEIYATEKGWSVLHDPKDESINFVKRLKNDHEQEKGGVCGTVNRTDLLQKFGRTTPVSDIEDLGKRKGKGENGDEEKWQNRENDDEKIGRPTTSGKKIREGPVLECRLVRRDVRHISIYPSSQGGCQLGCKFCWLTENNATSPVLASLNDYLEQVDLTLRAYIHSVKFLNKPVASWLYVNFMVRTFFFFFFSIFFFLFFFH